MPFCGVGFSFPVLVEEGEYVCKILLLSDLNSFGGTLLRPAALLFDNFSIAVLSSAHVIG